MTMYNQQPLRPVHLDDQWDGFGEDPLDSLPLYSSRPATMEEARRYRQEAREEPRGGAPRRGVHKPQ